ncbi:hypothetical protein VTK56DRAFT_2301 [Thermocarpiscus australiensis]
MCVIYIDCWHCGHRKREERTSRCPRSHDHCAVIAKGKSYPSDCTKCERWWPDSDDDDGAHQTSHYYYSRRTYHWAAVVAG